MGCGSSKNRRQGIEIEVDFSHVQKRALEYAITVLKKSQSKEKVEESTREMFDEFDKDGNGYLDRKELHVCFEHLFAGWNAELPVSSEYVEKMIDAFDEDKNQEIEHSEMIIFLQKFLKGICEQAEKELRNRKVKIKAKAKTKKHNSHKD